MTYAEVREMYTLDMALVDEERDNMRRVAREAFVSVSTWILPWAITILSVLLESSLPQKQKMLVLPLAFLTASFCGRMNRFEESPVRLLSIALSYLVAVAVVMTTFPVWN